MRNVREILCASLCLCVPLDLVGCTTQWIIPVCKEDAKTPCVGQCTIPADDSAQTLRTVPLAVVIRDHNGTLHCEAIEP